jgi:PqqD family protein of HPr-rel-A system
LAADDIVYCRTNRAVVWDRSWDLSIIFDPDSGQTHFLSELPALLLDNIHESPQTIEQLTASIDAPEDLTEEAQEQIRRALSLLEAKELIESRLPVD